MDSDSSLARSLGARGLLASRQMALRAIMDGRGVDSVILSAPASIAHYGGQAGPNAGLLIVTARNAHLLGTGAGTDADAQWVRAAGLLRRGCALGYEGRFLDPRAVARFKTLLAPARVLDIGPQIARQIAADAAARCAVPP